MSYRSRNSDIGSFIVGLWILYWVGHIGYEAARWPGVCITFGSIFLVIFISHQLWKWRTTRREDRLNREPCSHGVEGAVRDASRCESCTEERQEAKRIAKAKELEEQRRKNEERAQAHAEWVKRIRLPEYLKEMDPKEFERLICQLYAHLGYETQLTQYTADNGIDGFLRKDGHLTILQCKRVKGSVGQPILRDLYGTMRAENASSGLVVTTGKVSKQARDWVKGKPIEIIELEQLQRLIRDNFPENDVVPEEYLPGTTSFDTCPRCGHKLRLINGIRGKFLGCIGYPKCRYTRNSQQN